MWASLGQREGTNGNWLRDDKIPGFVQVRHGKKKHPGFPNYHGSSTTPPEAMTDRDRHGSGLRAIRSSAVPHRPPGVTDEWRNPARCFEDTMKRSRFPRPMRPAPVDLEITGETRSSRDREKSDKNPAGRVGAGQENRAARVVPKQARFTMAFIKLEGVLGGIKADPCARRHRRADPHAARRHRGDPALSRGSGRARPTSSSARSRPTSRLVAQTRRGRMRPIHPRAPALSDARHEGEAELLKKWERQIQGAEFTSGTN